MRSRIGGGLALLLLCACGSGRGLGLGCGGAATQPSVSLGSTTPKTNSLPIAAPPPALRTSLAPLLRTARFLEARQLLEKLPPSQRQHVELRLAEAWARVAGGDCSGLDELAAREREVPWAEGLRRLAQARCQRAQVARERSLKVAPVTGDAWQRATALAEAGDIAGTEAALATLAKSADPARRANLRGLARSSARAQHSAGADAYEEAASLEPSKASAHWFDAARLRTRAGQDRQAAELYARVDSRGGRQAEEASYLGARALAVGGEDKSALTAYERHLARYPRGPRADTARTDVVLLHLSLEHWAVALPGLEQQAQRSSSAAIRARWDELRAVALLGLTRQAEATALFKQIAAEVPFSAPAAFARLRLAALGEAAPALPTVAPATPMSLDLPPELGKLRDWGYTELAAERLSAQQGSLRRNKSGDAQRLCAAWELTETADRRLVVSRELDPGFELSVPLDAASRWRWDCRYPRPYPELVALQSDVRQMPHELLYAVMRQESSFRPRVYSKVGAVGLLQLMPSTASRIASEIGVAQPGSLEEPEVSLQLAAAYLGRLHQALGGHLALVIAAYNAGPNIVHHWAQQQHALPLDLFVARIAYAETRNYVYGVFSNLWVYRSLAGDSSIPTGFELALPKELQDPSGLY